MPDGQIRLRATTQIRNDYMLSARKRKNLTQAELACLSGVTQALISSLERLQYPSTYRYAEALLIADVLDIKPEQVMPEDMVGWKGQTCFSCTAEVTIEKLLEYKEHTTKHFLLSSPSELLENKDDMARIKLMINSLSAREKAIIELRYGLNPKKGGPYTLKDIAKIFSVTRERVREVEAKALRKLQKLASSATFMEEINRKSIDNIE
jgi:RNA polymerase sigma factor (sigma-70 family)